MTKTKLPTFSQFDKKANELANKVIESAQSGDRVKHWKAVHDLLRYQNKTARKEQDATARDCKIVREEAVVKKSKTAKLGMRWGVSMPQMTWNALVDADTLAFGRSDLREYNKEADADIKGSNQIVRDLEIAFPQYRVS